METLRPITEEAKNDFKKADQLSTPSVKAVKSSIHFQFEMYTVSTIQAKVCHLGGDEVTTDLRQAEMYGEHCGRFKK